MKIYNHLLEGELLELRNPKRTKVDIKSHKNEKKLLMQLQKTIIELQSSGVSLDSQNDQDNLSKLVAYHA